MSTQKQEENCARIELDNGKQKQRRKSVLERDERAQQSCRRPTGRQAQFVLSHFLLASLTSLKLTQYKCQYGRPVELMLDVWRFGINTP